MVPRAVRVATVA